MLIEKVNDYVKSQIDQWPVQSNRASELGHSCLRYLVLNRTRWREKILHDIGLQYIFMEGNNHEKMVMRLLQDAGFTIIEQQRPFDWKKYLISGHIDGKILENNHVYPFEIKGYAPATWQKLNTIDDFHKNPHYYVRKVPAQLNLYLLMDEKEQGLFILKNKLSGELKEIPMSLDYDLGEELVKKAESINEHVANETVPDCIPYDEEICGECPFIHICLPDVKRDALELQTDPELEENLSRYFELKPLKAEYDKLDKKLKGQFKEQEKVVIGDYLITGSLVARKGFTVEATEYWKTKIQKLGV